MTTVSYCHPLVPAEWIAAHGLQTHWLQPDRSPSATSVAMEGMCPYAGAVLGAACRASDAAAIVLTTVCDQMRYGAALLDLQGRRPVFLFNVPSTWHTATAEAIYLEELRRLGRFLVELGGASPSDEVLGHWMEEFDSARARLQAGRSLMSARQFARELIKVRSARPPSPVRGRGAGGEGEVRQAVALCPQQLQTHIITGGAHPTPPPTLPSSCREATRGRGEEDRAVPLALVGGPLVEKDFELFDLLERLGGRVVLDATENGTRMLPAPFDRRRMAADPLKELARAYFGAMPDVFRRPNDALYAWLERELDRWGVRGMLLRRYVWCDLWHAEVSRLRQWSPVPVLEIDVNHDDHGVPERIAGRVEAFLEMLR